MSNNLPDLNEGNIIVKIKNWFKNLFNKNKENSMQQDSKEDAVSNNFLESIKVENVENKEELLALHKKLESKEMEISDLSYEELDNMIEFYKEQIAIKKDKLKKIREKKSKNKKTNTVLN